MRAAAYRRTLIALAACCSLHAAQLPLRHYTSADGLPSNSILSITSDSRGFLWFGTAEGLSRFDGFGFTNQTWNATIRGSVRKVLDDRHGNFWLATPDGLIRFRPALPPSSPDRTLVMRPPGKPEAAAILTLLADRNGRIWCGTRAGLYFVDNPASPAPRLQPSQVELPASSWGAAEVGALAEDAEGALWIGAFDGTLYRTMNGRVVERYPATDDQPQAEITRLFADRQGRIWVGRANSLDRSRPAPHPGANGFERISGQSGGVPGGRVFDVFASREGDVWVAIYRCLAQFPADGAAVRLWTKDNGLPSRGIGVIAQDRDGNLWMGTGDLGTFKMAAGGILTYSAADGLGVDEVISLAETRRGELYFTGRLESEGFRVGSPAGDGFRVITPLVPPTVHYFGWRAARVLLQDRTGEWWLATSQGLCRYPSVETPSQLAQTAPKAVYTTSDGLTANVVTRLYEDRAGNIWAGLESGATFYWSRKEETFSRITGLRDAASAFSQDDAGNVWVGDEQGQLWRVANKQATRVPTPPGGGWIRDILSDHAGRIWVATNGRGLLRFDAPASAQPTYRQYGYPDGLSSMKLYSLAEDRNGYIYIGNGGGADRLDPDTGRVRHYTPADGIAVGEVIAAYRDRAGAMWFGTHHGLTRMIPEDRSASTPPPVWITGISVAGHGATASEAGESSIRDVELLPGQEHLQFDFVGLSYAPGNVLRYQYHLNDEPWSTPIESRTVHYGLLAPGNYRFSVRALNSNGEASTAPATADFRVVPPLWRRAWFQGLFLVLAIAGAVSVHRLRASRLLEIERVRSSIALDLHDDIASNLSQITIFSEIALHEAGADSRASEPLARIAETARDTVECINDIVWSIRPQKEGDLSQRMRRFGSDALTSRQMEVGFHFSHDIAELTLDPNTRRQVYLVYKEAVHNIVRHAHATTAAIRMTVDGGDLVLSVKDNGGGMDAPPEGNGLPGMRARAASLRGTLSIHSGLGRGTEVELRAPWKRHSRSRILPD